MPIEFKVPADLAKTLAKGALDGGEVWVQYLCQTGPDGQHDPDQPPDDKVRPSHAALHGQIFQLGEAPVPPLDYGCRCAIRYVAKPNSPAAEVLEVEADGEPTTAKAATTEWLEENVKGLDKLQAIAQKATPADAIGLVQAKAKELGIQQPRAIAEMVVDVTGGNPLPPPAAPTPPPPSPTPKPPTLSASEKRIKELEKQIAEENAKTKEIDKLLSREDKARERGDFAAVLRIQTKLRAAAKLFSKKPPKGKK